MEPTKKDQQIPQLPGIDSAAAVARLAGSTKLYVKTLCMFLKSMPSHEQELSDAFTQGDTQRLCRAAHTLKGLTATIGAKDVSALAAEMEAGINTTGALPEAAKLETLKLALEALGGTIAASGVCDESPAPAAPAPAANQAPGGAATEALKKALTTLKELLEADDAGAQDYFADQAGTFAAGLPADVRASLEESLRTFDYDAALGILKKM